MHLRAVRLSITFFVFMMLIAPTMTVQAGGVVGNGTPASCTVQSLRNAVASGGTVTFNCGPDPITITVNSQIRVEKPTVIDGGGRITLSGGGKSRILRNRYLNSLTLRNLTLRDGVGTPSSEDPGNGGAVYSGNQSSLTVSNVTFINNVSRSTRHHNNGGGAIYLHGGLLIVENSTFRDNRATTSSGGAISVTVGTTRIRNSVFVNNVAETGLGGAIFNDSTMKSDSVIRIINSHFEGNQAMGKGGGVWIWFDPNLGGSKAVVRNTRFINNVARRHTDTKRGYGDGGGLLVANGRLIVNASVFQGNAADSQGGGLLVADRINATVRNSTFSGNRAAYGGGTLTHGPANLTLINTTIAHNRASKHAGGVGDSGVRNIRLVNTIVAHNTAGNEWGLHQNCGAVYINGGGNMQFPAAKPSGDANCAAGILIRDPQLLAYDAASGMYPLSASSPAINRGINNGCPPVDQRGVARPQGDKCDVGAFEQVGNKPGGFSLSWPNAGARLARNDTRPTFQWTPAPGAESYVLTVRNNADAVVFRQVLTAAQANCGSGVCSSNAAAMTEALKRNKRYTWQVVARNIFGNVRRGPQAFRILSE